MIIFFFSSIKEEKEITSIKNFLINNSENLKCKFYLTPEILGLYYSMFLKNQTENNYYLPEVPDITYEANYKVLETNISLVKKSSIYIDFLRNNGLDCFALIYEYYFNLFKIIESDKGQFNFYLENQNVQDIIIRSINSTLVILHSNLSYFKNIISYKCRKRRK